MNEAAFYICIGISYVDVLSTKLIDNKIFC